MMVPLAARSEVTLIAIGKLPGTTRDRSGLKDTLPNGIPHDRLGGQGSGIAYTGKGNRYILVSDRGPKDGTDAYKCRFHAMDIQVTAGTNASVKIELVATTLLVDEKGKNFVGAQGAFDPDDPAKSMRLDPEGVRVARNGNLFICDEFGPYLYEFTPEGKRARSLKVPDKFLIARPSKDQKAELPPNNKKGRLANKSMEGLAIAPDGSRLFGIMENALIQDGALDSSNKRVGTNNRLLEVEIATGKSREFVYQLDSAKNCLCEIVAINEHEFVVIERDTKSGDEAKFKSLMKIDIAGATDVSDVESLPTKGLPGKIKPVSKKQLVNLLDPKWKLAGPSLPEKFEGLAFGPDLPDGRRLLLVTADNDYHEEQPFLVYAFAVDAADLPGFKPQQFE